MKSIFAAFKAGLPLQNPLPHKIFLLTLAAALSMAGLSAFLFFNQKAGGFDAALLFRDENAITGNPPYYGGFSNLGILGWAASATILLFTAYVLRQSQRSYEFFLTAGLLSLLFCFDDVYMLHEMIAPHFGIPEIVIFAAEGFLLAFLLLRHAHFILSRFWIPLALALAFMTFSVGIDYFEIRFVAETTVEDSAKLIGIFFWLYYFAHLSHDVLTRDI